MRVAITGAAGNIGRLLVEELSADYELYLIDRVPVPGRKSIVADLSQRRLRNYWRPWANERLPRWTAVFKEIDAVIHLAAETDPLASFQKVNRDNIKATWNVIEAAATHKVPRVVFASSNW